MQFNQISIKNFRGIKEKTILFNPGFNLLVGENGTGKTSILEAIAVGMGGFISGVEGVNTRNFSIEEIRKEYSRVSSGSCQMIKSSPVEVKISATINDVPYLWSRIRTSSSSSKTATTPKNIVKFAENITSQKGTELPIFLYQSAARVWTQKKEKVYNPFSRKFIRHIGYLDALDDATNVKMLKKWVLKMEQVSFKYQKTVDEYEAVKNAVAMFMKEINENKDEKYHFFYDPQLEEIMFDCNGDVQPVSALSSGYQSLVWMVFDIAYRMSLLNPQLGINTAKTHGVILIDELDMHLHPKWQWNVINAFTKVFPNVQFIASTHSAILLASAMNVNVIDLSEDEPKYLKSHYGIDINSAIEEFQKTSEFPQSIKSLIDEIQNNMDENKLEIAEGLIKELENTLGTNSHPMLAKLRTRLDLEKIM